MQSAKNCEIHRKVCGRQNLCGHQNATREMAALLACRVYIENNMKKPNRETIRLLDLTYSVMCSSVMCSYDLALLGDIYHRQVERLQSHRHNNIVSTHYSIYPMTKLIFNISDCI